MNNYNDPFVKTNKKVKVTFGGWDGTGYNGEPKTCTVYTHPRFQGKQFVRGYFHGVRCYHLVTNEKHPVSGETTLKFFTDITS